MQITLMNVQQILMTALQKHIVTTQWAHSFADVNKVSPEMAVTVKVGLVSLFLDPPL